MARVRAITAPLEAEYVVRPRGRRAEIEDTLTMAPPPPRTMAGMACLGARDIGSTLTRLTRRQFSRDSSPPEPRLPMPPLFSSTSRPPTPPPPPHTLPP